MNGLRIFERFGFNIPANLDQETPAMKLVTYYETWRFSIKIMIG
jgi:hypothetical protein